MGRGKTLTMPERAQVDLIVQLNMSVNTTENVQITYFSNNPYIWKHQAPNHEANPSNSTRAFLASKRIKVLAWPACSPDLNPIESVWRILARSVYKNGKQYNSISELKDAVKAEWNKIQPSYFENLSNSMPNRIFQVIEKNGGFTKY
uniref:DDE_3 domain-containing protein n=1 Tax=Caenorhabditis japonica TaxID=281687 RepID=A0A8R1IW62_CAEJA